MRFGFQLSRSDPFPRQEPDQNGESAGQERHGTLEDTHSHSEGPGSLMRIGALLDLEHKTLSDRPLHLLHKSKAHGPGQKENDKEPDPHPPCSTSFVEVHEFRPGSFQSIPFSRR